MVVCPLVVTDARPIQSFSGAQRVPTLVENIVVVVLGFGPLFVHEGDAPQRQFQVSGKLLPGQISLQAEPLDSAAVDEHDSGSPQDIKAVKLRGRLLDIDGDGKEILIDEVHDLLIGV